MELGIKTLKKGKILYHKEHEYGKKFIVILNDTTENLKDICVFCLTTTTPKSKRQPPCDNIRGYFYIPICEKDYFERETWLLLDDLQSSYLEDILNDIANGVIVTKEDSILSDGTVKDLMKCIGNLLEISIEYYELIFDNN
ncbi:MAG: hypothetical protein JW984_07480 [Deltaproteobacteria bacterium]|uniref:Uncharacterized protein n=1 Tax=Candidatus Zymogenus saltonus TaxID=2844893 RepID=A0A9D8PP19_9DELT|nr:hypothetical protein [Candidatus Zymogenus saltonus]